MTVEKEETTAHDEMAGWWHGKSSADIGAKTKTLSHETTKTRRAISESNCQIQQTPVYTGNGPKHGGGQSRQNQSSQSVQQQRNRVPRVISRKIQTPPRFQRLQQQCQSKQQTLFGLENDHEDSPKRNLWEEYHQHQIETLKPGDNNLRHDNTVAENCEDANISPLHLNLEVLSEKQDKNSFLHQLPNQPSNSNSAHKPNSLYNLTHMSKAETNPMSSELQQFYQEREQTTSQLESDPFSSYPKRHATIPEDGQRLSLYRTSPGISSTSTPHSIYPCLSPGTYYPKPFYDHYDDIPFQHRASQQQEIMFPDQPQFVEMAKLPHLSYRPDVNKNNNRFYPSSPSSPLPPLPPQLLSSSPPPRPPPNFVENQQTSIFPFHAHTNPILSNRQVITNSKENQISDYPSAQSFMCASPDVREFSRAIRGREIVFRSPLQEDTFDVTDPNHIEIDTVYQSPQAPVTYLQPQQEVTSQFTNMRETRAQHIAENVRMFHNPSINLNHRPSPISYSQTRHIHHSYIDDSSLQPSRSDIQPTYLRQQPPPYISQLVPRLQQLNTNTPSQRLNFLDPFTSFQSSSRDQSPLIVQQPVKLSPKTEYDDSKSKDLSLNCQEIEMQSLLLAELDNCKPLSPLYDSSYSDSGSTLSTVPGITSSSSSSSSTSSLYLPIVDNYSPHSLARVTGEDVRSPSLQKQSYRQFYRRLYKIRKRFTAKWIEDNLSFLADPTTNPYTPSLQTSEVFELDSTLSGSGAIQSNSPLASLHAGQQLMQQGASITGHQHSPDYVVASIKENQAVHDQHLTTFDQPYDHLQQHYVPKLNDPFSQLPAVRQLMLSPNLQFQ